MNKFSVFYRVVQKYGLLHFVKMEEYTINAGKLFISMNHSIDNNVKTSYLITHYNDLTERVKIVSTPQTKCCLSNATTSLTSNVDYELVKKYEKIISISSNIEFEKLFNNKHIELIETEFKKC